MENAIGFVFQIAILIFSVVIHEVSHGYAALRLGDKTAYYEGRLTLNPLKHLDPFGSVLLPLITYFAGGIIFGWARPVPYNPHNLRNQKWGAAIVGVAGPAANIVLAIAFGLSFRFLPAFSGAIPGSVFFNFLTILSLITLLNVVLAVFNLVPIPPLDGSKVLFALLPYQWRYVQDFLEQYGLFLLVIFVLFFIQWLLPLALFLFRMITGTMPLL